MSEMPLSGEARKIFRVGVALSVAFGLYAMAPESVSEQTSFVPMPQPIIVPIRMREHKTNPTQQSREIPWTQWRNVG